MPGTFPGTDGQVPTRLASDSGGWVWDWAKIRETGGPTTLTFGAIPDGQALRRSGSTIVGEPITQAGAANSLLKTDASGRARLGADPSNVLDAATKQYVDALLPEITHKPGSGAGDYTTTSTTYVDVDATNLAFTVTVPSGKKIVMWASGTVWTGASTVRVALADGTTTLVEVEADGNTADSFALNWVFVGDGASHTFKLRWMNTNAGTATMRNGTTATTNRPSMLFMMMKV